MEDKLIYVYQHRVAIAAWIMAALAAWCVPASFLARFIPRPKAAPGWRNALARALYDLFVDPPSLVAALARVGIFGGVANLPGMPSRLPIDNPPVERVPPPLPPPPAG